MSVTPLGFLKLQRQHLENLWRGWLSPHRLSANGVHASAARACEQAQSSRSAESPSIPSEEKWELTPHSSNHSEDTLFTSGDLITFSSTFLSYLGAKCLSNTKTSNISTNQSVTWLSKQYLGYKPDLISSLSPNTITLTLKRTLRIIQQSRWL